MARPTMEDVAREAGVSRSLVSLVFQGASNVSEARRTAVLHAADRLGYRPNRLARNLARGRSMTVGVVIDDLHPFFAAAIEAIEDRAKSGGYHVLIANGARDADRTVEALSTFSALQVDGAIAVGARGEVSGLIAATPSIPLVLVSFESTATAIDTVNSDEALGSALAVEHLVSLGHERILHVDGGKGASAAARRAGYSAAMKRLGLGSQISILSGELTVDAGRKAAVAVANSELLPTAIFAANDLTAVGMISEFDRLGISVPGDISIVGYDDTSIVGIGADGITTIHQPISEMGTRAAELLIERLDGRTEPTHEILAPSLVVRSSTGPAATTNP